MRALLRIGLCCLFTSGLTMAQRGGGGHGGGGGGVRGGGFGGGGVRVGGGYGGYGSGGYRGGSGGYYGGYRGYGYGGYGFGLGYYGSSYPYSGYGYGYGYPYYDSYISTYPGYTYPVYQYNPSPNVTVIYPGQQQQAAAPAYTAPAQPATRAYDQYGQQVQPGASAPAAPSGSPIYLIAMKDQTIRAAASYWVDGRTLHYVTLQHQETQTPLDSVDRGLSLQLNRERRVTFSLPQ